MKRAKWISAFLAGAVFGAIPSGALLASAAVGDALYEQPPQRKCITAPQALCYAQCSLADGAWDGLAVDMFSAGAQRDDSCPAGFSAEASGLKAAPLAEVPVGSRVHGVVVEE
jgi:hypothetical protein